MQRIIYRIFRCVKDFILRGNRKFLGFFFFHALDIVQKFISPRDLKRDEMLNNILFRQNYFARYGLEPIYCLDTQMPVAIHSHDHIYPRGTALDSSTNHLFNRGVYAFLGHQKRPLKVLDFGCSGAGMVRSFIEDGHEAIGLEGSNYSLLAQSGEWPNIPHHLFTCDITKPFHLKHKNGDAFLCDLITSWEVLEHISENDLPNMLKNIHLHLKEGGLFIGSVDFFADGDTRTGAVYHATLKPREWWVELFHQHGFQEEKKHPFITKSFVRGNGSTLKDWSPDDGHGFHIIARKA